MPDKPAVPWYISPLLPAVKPRGPTPSISRTCTFIGAGVSACVPYITLPCRFVPRRYLLLTKIWKSVWLSLEGSRDARHYATGTDLCPLFLFLSFSPASVLLAHSLARSLVHFRSWRELASVPRIDSRRIKEKRCLSHVSTYASRDS